MENSKASAGGPERFIDTGLLVLIYMELILWVILRDAWRWHPNPNMALHLFVALFWVKNVAAGLCLYGSKRTGDIAFWIANVLFWFGHLALITAGLACVLVILS
jgi:hypothetical protein